jgi:hypothetical protein
MGVCLVCLSHRRRRRRPIGVLTSRPRVLLAPLDPVVCWVSAKLPGIPTDRCCAFQLGIFKNSGRGILSAPAVAVFAITGAPAAAIVARSVAAVVIAAVRIASSSSASVAAAIAAFLALCLLRNSCWTKVSLADSEWS